VQTWATSIDNKQIFALQNGTWIQVNDGVLTHVTVGKSGVWGVTRFDGSYFRQGVAPDTPYGTKWLRTGWGFQQVDAGSSGVVYGVNGYLFSTSIWLRSRVQSLFI
jgi:hypothetical protein